ncbi:VOC family protein [Sphingopyxis fribergensis]|jgi:catechol 2,3-dioxygenase-like lactoylglutathione lyase family enzyme
MNSAPPPRTPDAAPSIDGSILFFYYDDLDTATRWYRDILGLETILHEEWLVLLQLRPGTVIGLVDAAGGSHLPLRGGSQGAMLSIESNAVETWLDRFKTLGICAATTPLTPGCRGRTLEFRVRDPGGYMVEFFRWTDRP